VGARALIAASCALVAACAGPDPGVEHVAVMPSPQAGETRVIVDLVNRSHGHGQIQVNIELRDTSTGNVIPTERLLELGDHQRAQLVADVETPAGSYVASVRVHYPD
jgi:hypothetical protein